MSKYSDLLTDPRWQKKRLEVLSEANFRCQKCGGIRRRLDVHHKQYRSGALPWEYENHEFEVLCRICHETEHVVLTDDERETEAKISEISQRILSAPTTTESKQWFGAMRILIAGRSPELVRKLELLKGLAK